MRLRRADLRLCRHFVQLSTMLAFVISLRTSSAVERYGEGELH